MENDQPAPPQVFPPAKSHKMLLISIFIALCLIAGAVYWRYASAQQNNGAGRTFTAAQLAEFDGQSGKQCYVAVDGVVYEIEQGRLWKDGKHESSEGQASCGRDLSEVIKQSPHGKSKLTALPEVGTLTN